MKRLSAPAGQAASSLPLHQYEGHNSTSMRQHNRGVVLQAILRHGPTSRAHLVQLTGRQPATISSLVGELLDDGILEEAGRSEIVGTGRPRINLDFAAAGVYAVGIHIGVEWVTYGLVSPRGHVRWEDRFRRQPEVTPAATLARAITAVRTLLARATVSLDRVVGLGVDVAAALVDPVQGRVVRSVGTGWSDVPLAQPFRQGLDLPVAVGSNVHAMALGESWFGVHKEINDLALLFVGTTIGTGLVVNGRLVRGAAWGAGQIGHSRVVHDHLARCSCGNVGCLETVASVPAILEDARQSGLDLNTVDGRLHETGTDLIEALIDRGLRGERVAVDVLGRAGDALGVAAAQVINLINPRLVVLAGQLARAGELVLGPMRRSAANAALPILVEQTRIEPASLGAKGQIIGPASLALVECFYAPGQLHRVYH